MSVQKIIKPVTSEKSNKLSELNNTYIFVVDRRVNKLEIKKEVETLYGVAVEEINTLVIPSKAKSRFTKKGIIKGRKPSYKKAYVTLGKGNSIDFYAL